jgi:beta-lactamase regulating signal transducer with metallopeptidase domain
MLAQLLEAAFRSLALGAAVWLSLRLLTVQYPQARMTAWTVVLAASVSMVLLMHQVVVTIPGYSLRPASEAVEHGSPAIATGITTAPTAFPLANSVSPASSDDAAPAQQSQRPAGEQLISAGEQLINAIDWQPIAMGVYFLVAGGLLLRLLIGLTLSWRLLGKARPIATDWTAGVDVRVSAAVATPVTVGTAILLPVECLYWSPAKRQAVLAHERSHAVRGDFYVLLLAMLHRAVFWFSPFSWWLLSELAKTAELVSDDAAIEVLGDRSAYAEILLDVARSARKAPVGIAMARTRNPLQRVDRILALAVPSAKLGRGRQALVAVSLAPLVAMTVSVAKETDPSAISSPRQPISSSPTSILEPEPEVVAPKLWILGRVYRNANPDEMFGTDAAWKTVAAHTAVVKFMPAALWNAGEQDLRRAFQNLAARHIDLAFEIHPLVRTERCTQKTRAYSDPDEVEKMLERIQRLGGGPRYFVMAAPFYFGHRWSGVGSCHEPPEDLARQIAQTIQLIHTRFPKAEIGTSELVESNDWTDELVNWSDVYQRAIGEPLAFFHAEVAWSDPATKNLVKLARAMKARHIPFGITYDGDEESSSSDEWTESALKHIAEIESTPGLHPDAAIFRGPFKFPSRLLPETQFGTLTNLAYQYLLVPPSITLTRQDKDIVSGQMADAQGHPVAAASVIVEAVDAAGRMNLMERHLTGTVPQDAVAAMVAILVNSGGSCVCAGPATASIGAIRYSEITTGRSEEIPPFLPTAGKVEPPVRLMQLVPDETQILNLKLFPATPGATFELDAPLTVTVNGERAGQIAIMFLDSTGRELRRDRLWFHPSVKGLANIVTNADGRFQIDVPSWVAETGAEIRAYFLGNDSLASQTVFISQDEEQASAISERRASPLKESRADIR